MECWQVCRQVSRAVLGQCIRTWEFLGQCVLVHGNFFLTYAFMWNVDRSADRPHGQFWDSVLVHGNFFGQCIIVHMTFSNICFDVEC